MLSASQLYIYPDIVSIQKTAGAPPQRESASAVLIHIKSILYPARADDQ
jgi:hypothetical protein